MLTVSLACAFVSAPLREDRVTFGSPLLLTVIVRNGKFFAYLAELCFLSLPSVKSSQHISLILLLI